MAGSSPEHGLAPASHRDRSAVRRVPEPTMRYDRARVSLDRYATYIVAAFVAGAAR
jgi:L-lactate utilization protein LutB